MPDLKTVFGPSQPQNSSLKHQKLKKPKDQVKKSDLKKQTNYESAPNQMLNPTPTPKISLLGPQKVKNRKIAPKLR